jgi:hypothetical protein
MRGEFKREDRESERVVIAKFVWIHSAIVGYTWYQAVSPG